MRGGGLHFITKVSLSSVYYDVRDREYLSLINCTFSSNRAMEGAGVHVLLLVQWQH